MSAEALFILASVAVLPAWLLLIVAPGASLGSRLVGPVLVPALLASLYVYVLVAHLPGAPGGLTSLQDLRVFFDRPFLLLAGWVHYLALDLFAGSWEARDATRNGIPRALLAPCLVLTLLLGPFGLLCYLAVRAVRLRRLGIE